MHYIAAIRQTSFYSRAVVKPHGLPTVIVREGRVLDACPKALDHGIRTGIQATEAKSILNGNGHIVEWEEEHYRQAQHEWLSVAADYSDVIEPLSQHEALVDLSGHPRPREVAHQIEKSLRSRTSSRPEIGLARCRWVARMAAWAGDAWGLAHADPAHYVSEFPVERLPFPAEISRHLRLLGYRTIGELAAVSARVIEEQFGGDAREIMRAAKGEGEAHVASVFPPDSTSERFVWEVPPETQAQVESAINRLASQLGAALRNQDRSGRKLEAFLENESSAVECRRRTFSHTLADEPHLRTALNLLLLEDWPRNIVGLRVRLAELVSSTRVQLDLQGQRSRGDAEQSLDIAVRHVQQTFGDNLVRFASDLPEPRWIKVKRAYQEGNGFFWL